MPISLSLGGRPGRAMHSIGSPRPDEGNRMAGSGTALFTDPTDYETSVAFMRYLLPLKEGEFRARCTWVALPHIRLFRASEAVGRIGSMALPADRIHVMFQSRSGPPLLHCGMEMRRGEFVLQAPGQRFHQRVPAGSHWGCIAIASSLLGECARILTGEPIEAPMFGRIYRPCASDRERLLRLHAEACRITETRLTNIGHPEVSRALEQDLIWSLVTCLAPESKTISAGRREATETVLQCEDALNSAPGLPVTVKTLCRATQVSERRLRAAFMVILGLSPGLYLRLRRSRRPNRGDPCRARQIL